MEEHKYIDIKEFREVGYLQEVNRRFFHPLGLALVVDDRKDGSEYLIGIWDLRDDPEGVYFADGVLDKDKANRIDSEFTKGRKRRFDHHGYFIQPVGN